MAHFGSSQRPAAGQRRDSSVMSIASLIDGRGGEGYPRLPGGPIRPSHIPRLGISPIDNEDDEDELDMPSPTFPHGEWRSNTSTAQSSSREPRPSYTEEQKFFIMWARIVQEKGWTEIEDEFTRIFNQRTKGGLTSVYYRIRRSWKLKDVLSGDPSSSDADRMAVAARASNFSGGFLREIGYAM